MIKWSVILAEMSDEEIAALQRGISEVQESRAKIIAPTLPEPTEEETKLYNSGHRVEAIRAYRDRVNKHLTLVTVRTVFMR